MNHHDQSEFTQSAQIIPSKNSKYCT